MRKIYFTYNTGYVGMESHSVVEYDDEVTDEELDEDAWQGAIQNAESYGIYPDSDLDDYSQEDYDHMVQSGDIDSYSSGIEGSWEEYDAEKHDGTY